MNDDVGATPVYSMGVAERLTGLTGRQIRYWEQHGLITPSRTKGRQRMYTEADILRLKEIKRLLSDGVTLDRVKSQLAARDAKRTVRSADDLLAHRMVDRTSRGGSLYGGGNRAELQRMIDRKTDR